MSNIFPGSTIFGSVYRGAARIGTVPAMDPFEALIAQATIVGSGTLPLTNVRTGARKSIIDGTDVAANTPDLRLVNGLFVASSLKGDQNVVDTVMTSAMWNIIDGAGASLSMAEPLPYIYRYTANTGTSWGTRVREGFTAITAANGSCDFECRYISGDQTVLRAKFANGDPAIQPDALMGCELRTGGVWIWVSVAPDLGRVEIQIQAAGPTEGGVLNADVVVEFRNMRIVDSTAAAAGFPDGSPTNTAYAVDINSFTFPTIPVGTMQIPVTPYGWSSSGNPANAECVLFEAGSMQVKLTAAGRVEIAGTAASTKKLTADTLSVATIWWDGVNHTLQVDGETPVVAASAIVPSGTGYDGNNAAGTHPSHSVEHIAIYSKTLTPEEVTTGEEGYEARLGTGAPPVLKFVSTWNTENLGGTGSATKTILLPMTAGPLVDWDDGTINNLNTHVYAVGGVYEIRIDDTNTDFRFNSGGDELKIVDVVQSNGLNITNSSVFSGCSNLGWSATDAPAIATIDLTNTFFGCSKLVGAGLCNLDVSLVENFTQMYLGCTLFNEAIGVYNMGSAKNISGMLRSCPNFNQPVGIWNVGNVEQASHVFAGSGYNQPLGDWDVRKFQNTHAMLSSCPYNHPLTNWQTLAWTNPSWMFNGNSQFNQPLAHLYMGLVTALDNFLNGASSFDQDLTGLNIGNVGNMNAILSNTGMSTANYDKFLEMCEGQPVQSGNTVGAQGLTYTADPGAGGIARDKLGTAPQLWNFVGDSAV